MKYLALLALGLALGWSAPAPIPPDPSEQQIRKLEAHHLKAFLSRDQAALDSMFSDDFIVNSPQNRVVEKAELLGMVKRGILTLSKFDQTIERIRRFGDMVVVMGEDRVVFAPPSPAAGQTQRRRFTDIWQLRDGSWKFVARQATILAP